MKKQFDWGILLLPMGYLLFALAVFVAFRPTTSQQDLPTEKTIRDSFDQYFEEFDQVSHILWSHPDFFDGLYEKTEVRALLLNTQDALEKGNEAGYLTEEEWNRLKALCTIAMPYEITLRSHDGVNAIEWIFTVQQRGQDEYLLILYYIHALDASSPEKEQAAIDNAVSYLGQYSDLSPMEGKDFWYESVIFTNPKWDESSVLKDLKE